MIYLDHHLLLKIRQNPKNLYLDLLFKPLAKYLDILDYYLDSDLGCNCTMKPLSLAPSRWGLWLIYCHDSGHLESRLNVPFFLPATL